MELGYFPGCSLHGTSSEYDASTKAVCEALGIVLKEIDDWSCCGSTSAHATRGDLAMALAARNVALATKMGLDVVVPCAACYNRLRTAEVAAREGKLPEGVEPMANPVGISSLAQVLARPEMIAAIAAKVVKPLAAVTAVAYYGCLLVRPSEITGCKNPEDPQEIDDVLEAVGVVAKPWSMKTFCCGGGHALSRPDVVGRLTGRIIERARRAGAGCIVTACPMCTTNLEIQQFESLRAGRIGKDAVMPVMYLTELVALALGMDAVDAWLGKHSVDPRPYLAGRGLA